MASTRRKSAAIALAVIGIAGLSLAAAAQLTVNSGSLQAGAVDVGVCDADGVTVSYTTGFAGGVYGVTHVTVSGINVTGAASCLGKTLDVTLYDTLGASLGTATVTPITSAGSELLPLTASAATTTGVAVVIH